jgi:FMN phosphatase YigB (HAD superfamily)
MRRENLILVDVDGVLLDWEWGFYDFIKFRYPKLKLLNPNAYKVGEKFNITAKEGRALSREFNNSARIGSLNPLRDSVKYVKKLYSRGYMFHAITSQSLDPYSQKLRISNLENIFGKIFVDYTILDTGADKGEALKTITTKYPGENFYWIEDKGENLDLGEMLGLEPILMSHPHNIDYIGNRVHYWEEIHNYIVFGDHALELDPQHYSLQ